MKINVTRVGETVSIHLHCATEKEADDAFYKLMSGWLDNSVIELSPDRDRPPSWSDIQRAG